MRRTDKLISCAMWVCIAISLLVILDVAAHKNVYRSDGRYTVAVCLVKAFVNGNVGAARYWDAQRRDEQRDVNAEKADIHHDRVDLARHRFDRSVDVIKRKYDASKL